LSKAASNLAIGAYSLGRTDLLGEPTFKLAQAEANLSSKTADLNLTLVEQDFIRRCRDTVGAGPSETKSQEEMIGDLRPVGSQTDHTPNLYISPQKIWFAADNKPQGEQLSSPILPEPGQ
jgi:hypothetical protein